MMCKNLWSRKKRDKFVVLQIASYLRTSELRAELMLKWNVNKVLVCESVT